MDSQALRGDERHRFTEYLRAHGYKLTPERMTVFEEVAASGEHFTVDDLYDTLRSRGERRVSRATIYRTLELLAESGLVNKIDWMGTTTHYEIAQPDAHHDHFICTFCGAIYEFFSAHLEQVQDEVCAALGLIPDDHTLKITGTPGYCRERITYPEVPPAERGTCPFRFKFRAEAAESV